MHNTLGMLAIASVALACSSSPQLIAEDIAQPSGRILQATNTPATSSDAGNKRAPAFAHDIRKSRFSIGQLIKQTNVSGAYRLEGSEGAFTFLQTGLAMAKSNAKAKVRLRGGPPAGGASAHNQGVREYFVTAGLHEDQIDTVEAYPVVTTTWSSVDEKPMSEKPRLEYYNTMIKRQLAGIPVSESYAWARLNQDGEVVAESVYWPEIPESVVTDGLTLADSASGPTFAQALPSRSRKKVGRVTIHHTPGEWTKGFSAVAVYDVPNNNVEMPSTDHFDARAKRVVLPHEAKDAWGSRR